MGLFNMRMITLVCLMLVSTLLAAQEKEIWACQGIDSTGFIWRDGKWEGANFVSNNYLITIGSRPSFLRELAGETFDATVKLIDGREYDFKCQSYDAGSSCINKFALAFHLNTVTGKGAFTRMFGSTNEDVERDSVSVELFQCTKF